jgi:hypothetical protein
VTPFAHILQKAVQATPNAIGGAFAAGDGEMVDSFAQIDPHEWAVITAHYGIVLSHLTAAFGTWHFGFPEYFIAKHAKLEVVVHAVDGGYFALMAFHEQPNLPIALEQLRVAAGELRKEMA